MSLLWVKVAHSDEYPIYEVGSPDEATNPYTRNYGSADRVPPGHFGLHKFQGELPRPKGEPRTERVPTSSLRATQSYVYKPHVENLATVPAHVLERSHSIDPIDVRRVGGYHVVLEGHHRAAASILRGDKDTLVTVKDSE